MVKDTIITKTPVGRYTETKLYSYRYYIYRYLRTTNKDRTIRNYECNTINRVTLKNRVYSYKNIVLNIFYGTLYSSIF